MITFCDLLVPYSKNGNLVLSKGGLPQDPRKAEEISDLCQTPSLHLEPAAPGLFSCPLVRASDWGHLQHYDGSVVL